jgi:3-oxoacyl-[acyl-carrier protein] reductase
MRFKGKIVLVTGSTRGIGKEIAHSFAQEGATVMITGRQEQPAVQAAQELIQQGFSACGFGCDVTNLKSVGEMVNKILDKYKTIDILVNNAGTAKDNLLLRMDESDWDEVINTNLRGVFHCTKVVLKPMLKSRAGKIISISSIIGLTGNIGQANYAASKAGIIGFSKSIAREVASRGITVNVIAPGYIQTDMTAQLPEKTREEILRNIPLKRLGTPKNVAGVCLFLASKEADYITGQTILVDGGMGI